MSVQLPKKILADKILVKVSKISYDVDFVGEGGEKTSLTIMKRKDNDDQFDPISQIGVGEVVMGNKGVLKAGDKIYFDKTIMLDTSLRYYEDAEYAYQFMREIPTFHKKESSGSKFQHWYEGEVEHLPDVYALVKDGAIYGNSIWYLSKQSGDSTQTTKSGIIYKEEKKELLELEVTQPQINVMRKMRFGEKWENSNHRKEYQGKIALILEELVIEEKFEGDEYFLIDETDMLMESMDFEYAN